eukprot:CAMPEP_0168330430 /NCGR_PEP_ID=MMETSP0213-20121227/7733_1 /TAXON_ID=151035 /ORGANISM="Euplotes harpa, Strain FSP1.4" /LENGTH=115 /DNA_ID=CAMNT_0008334013 /DNA_START=38 /DNA_END=385 /DNA_ORIENTATION=+
MTAEFKQKSDLCSLHFSDDFGLDNPEAWMEAAAEPSKAQKVQSSFVTSASRQKSDKIQSGLDYNALLMDKLADPELSPEDHEKIASLLAENLSKMAEAANNAIDRGKVYRKISRK